VSDVQKVLEALTSPVRREILWLIWDTELPAGEIAAAFEVTAPTISEHLAVLRAAGLVTVQATGSFRRYRAHRDNLRRLQSLVFGESPSTIGKWTPADNLPETVHARAGIGLVVATAVDVACDRGTAFSAFTDAKVFSRWLGVPVTIDEGRFACTMEWGTSIRGTYDVVVAPELIALRWDFEDDNIPVPGAELVAYVRFSDTDTGCRVDVHQLVERVEQARFMEVAWTMVLGRLNQGIGPPVASEKPAPARGRRPKTGGGPVIKPVNKAEASGEGATR
jgi:DNA-binding transcriptional ArsR family regulator